MTALASVSVGAQQNSDLAGSYLYRFEFGGTEITLKNNGTFTAATSNCTGVTTASGPYSVSNNVVRFRTTRLTARDNGDMKEHDLTKRKERKKYLETNEPFKPHSWELQVVRWGERIYLMNRKLFGSFIDVVNVGFEPRFVDGYRTYYGEIHLRVGDEKKPVTGRPPLPEEFLRELLPAPIIATVIELKTNGDSIVATIDRGSADGLKENMTLVSTIPTDYFEPFSIDSISEHSAHVRVHKNIKVGDQLSTRVTDVLRYSE